MSVPSGFACVKDAGMELIDDHLMKLAAAYTLHRARIVGRTPNDTIAIGKLLKSSSRA